MISRVLGIPCYQSLTQSEYFINTQRYRMRVPKLYMYVSNRPAQMSGTSSAAFKKMVNEIGEEIYALWRANANLFCIHPTGAPIPSNRRSFKSMFQFEVSNAAAAQSQIDHQVSGVLGVSAAIE
jgi:hypothetical protein